MRRTRAERLANISAGIGGTYDLWGDLNRRINNGQVVPIISNAVVNNRIFDIREEGRIGLGQDRDEYDQGHQLAIDDQLAREWADFVEYPLVPEGPELLSKVAQYNQVSTGYPDVSKTHYLTFLKMYLLELATEDENVADVLDTYMQLLEGKSFVEIVDVLSDSSFSEIVYQLGYPRYEAEFQDPLYLLAQLPLPTYVTTSHHDFLERGLRDVEKYPRVYVCNWFGDEDPRSLMTEWFDMPASGEDVHAEPTVVAPVVYHLCGLEKYPATLVISEDDYMQFLERVSEDRNVVPWQLRRALAQSSMILIGYRLRSWEFMVLFRGIIRRIIQSSKQSSDKPNIAVQLLPPVHQWEADSVAMQDYVQEAKQYIESYFTPSFVVEWDSAVGFAQKLWRNWREGAR